MGMVFMGGGGACEGKVPRDHHPNLSHQHSDTEFTPSPPPAKLHDSPWPHQHTEPPPAAPPAPAAADCAVPADAAC